MTNAVEPRKGEVRAEGRAHMQSPSYVSWSPDHRLLSNNLGPPCSHQEKRKAQGAGRPRMHGEDRRRADQDRWPQWHPHSPEGNRGAHGGRNPAERTEDPEQR